MLFIDSWVWNHLLEYGRSTRRYILRKLTPTEAISCFGAHSSSVREGGVWTLPCPCENANWLGLIQSCAGRQCVILSCPEDLPQILSLVLLKSLTLLCARAWGRGTVCGCALRRRLLSAFDQLWGCVFTTIFWAERLLRGGLRDTLINGHRDKHSAGRFLLCLFRIVHVGAGDVSSSLYACPASPLRHWTTSPAPETLSMSDLAGN